MSDGTESLLGKKSLNPNASLSLPSYIKIAKLRIGFEKNRSYPGLFYLSHFKLFDSNGGMIWTCGDDWATD